LLEDEEITTIICAGQDVTILVGIHILLVDVWYYKDETV
jgi:hypothetical protein